MKSLFFFLFCIFLLLNSFVVAQQRKEPFAIHSQKKGKIITLHRQKWAYKTGDSTVWAKPDFDDSQWEKRPPYWRLDSVGKKDNFKNIAWFRLKFKVDSNLFFKNLFLKIAQVGACEVYLDGRLIGRLGTPHQDIAKELVAPSFYSAPHQDIDLKQVIPFYLDGEKEHTLAIRFSYHHYEWIERFLYTRESRKGIQVFLALDEQYLQKADKENSIFSVRFWWRALAVGHLLMGILLLLLYMFFPKNRYTFWFGLTILSESIIYFILEAFIYLPFEYQFFVNFIFRKLLQTLPFQFLTLLCLYRFFAGKQNRAMRLFIYALSLDFLLRIITLFPFIEKYAWIRATESLVYAIFVFTYVFFLYATFRLVLKSIWKQEQGTKILGVGYGAFYILYVLGFFVDAFFNNFSDLLYLLSSFPILLSITLFIAYKNGVANQNLEFQLEETKRLSAEKQQILETQKEVLEDQVTERTLQLQEAIEELNQTNEELNTTLELVEKERQKSDALLLNILPAETAQELKEKGFATPKHYDLITVLFTDFKGFTNIAEKISPAEVIENLNTCFLAFDEICDKYGLEKIKTIGDAYMCAGGLPVANTTNPVDVVLAGLEMQAFMARWKTEKEAQGLPTWELRLGIHSGEAMAGVVGKNKFAYDIWGDTVNLASRMESSGEVGKVNISGATYELVKDRFECIFRGKIQAKNKGEVEMYFVEGAKA